MRGDFSRIRLSAGKGYTSVLQQQGRVALDADANEQQFLDDARRRRETTDIVGPFGGPAGDEGFSIDPSSGDIVIGPGRYYVAGLLCENPAPVSYDSQPYLSVQSGTGAGLLAGLSGGTGQVVQVYLQTWQRLVTALDDSCLGEPALGQADTTARVQTVWRVLARPEQMSAGDAPASFCSLLQLSQPAPSTGRMTVTLSGAAADCGCGPVAAAGYQGLENQLYRVEIQQGGDASGATFKWSRENGSVVAAVTSVTNAADGTGAVAQVGSVGPDANLGFSVGDWVELTDDTLTFGPTPGQPGSLYQIRGLDKESQSVTLSSPVTGIDPSRNARLRRWDQSGPSARPGGVPLPLGPSAAELENGIQVSFGAGSYQPGDHWTFPARTATGSVDWPPCGSDGNPAQPPSSVTVYEAPLAVLHWDQLRVIDPPTTAGDTAVFRKAGATETGVLRDDATIAETGAAQEAYPAPAATPVRGTVGTTAGTIGTAIGTVGTIGTTIGTAGTTGTAGTIGTVAGRPAGGHGPVLIGYVAVQDCRKPFSPLTALSPAGAGQAIHVQQISWANDDVLALDTLIANPLTVTLDQPAASPVSRGNFIVSIEPLTQSLTARAASARAFVPAYTLSPVEVVNADITAAGQTLSWALPPAAAQDMQDTLIAGGDRGQFVRTRVRLPGNTLFASGAAGPIYLDGRALGQAGTRADGVTPRVDLRWPSGTGAVTSDFESWFYLAPAQGADAVFVTPSSLTAISDGRFIGVEQTGTTTGLITPTGTVDLLYDVIATPVTVSLTLTSDGGGSSPGGTVGVGTIASVPASVTIQPGNSSATFTPTFAASPPANTTYTFTVTASVSTAVGGWTISSTGTFTVAGPTITTPVLQ